MVACARELPIHIWGLQAALLDVPCAARELLPDIKEALRKQVKET